MRLIIECEHGKHFSHIEALAEAGVLNKQLWSDKWGNRPREVGDGEWTRKESVRYVSPWKEAE